ncbi:hypothetical protein Taro_044108 [Colocasia esculenta]|uniref:Uncharacterized protein n=1 Tax=Colocasia esculenta TaxID=4460 RepID=A0A843X505_COLES|nr:hypothetical protein [Colocasia esculenta]
MMAHYGPRVSYQQSWSHLNRPRPFQDSFKISKVPPPLIGHCQASRRYIPEQVIYPSTPNNCGGVPNRNSNPAARNNPGYHRTACSSPHVGHLLGKCFQRVPSRFSGSWRGCNCLRPRTPPSRGTNCLAAQRAPERITPPVLVLTGDRLPYSLSSGGPFGSSPNRITPPHIL